MKYVGWPECGLSVPAAQKKKEDKTVMERTYEEVCLLITRAAEDKNDGGFFCTGNFEVLLLCQKRGKRKNIFPSSKEKLRVVAAVET